MANKYEYNDMLLVLGEQAMDIRLLKNDLESVQAALVQVAEERDTLRANVEDDEEDR